MEKPSQEELQRRRRELRKHMTASEEALWALLRNRRFHDKKFRRQHPVGSYIVDFFCFSENLIVELDGNHHFEDPDIVQYDEQRSNCFRKQVLKVIRFENQLVLDYPEIVLNHLKEVFNNWVKITLKCENPSPPGGGCQS